MVAVAVAVGVASADALVDAIGIAGVDMDEWVVGEALIATIRTMTACVQGVHGVSKVCPTFLRPKAGSGSMVSRSVQPVPPVFY